MSRKAPQIVGIVGGSCAGKTWLAQRLQEHAPAPVARLALDDFYLDRGHLSAARRARLNFDHPRAIDWERLEQVLERLRAGASVASPRYDFATHRRLPVESILDPAPVVLVEGLWLFRKAAVRRHFDVKVFIQGPEELRASRRLERDTTERGRTAGQVREQWSRFAEPMFGRYVAPQARWADVVLQAPIGEEQARSLAESLMEKAGFQTKVGI